MISTADLKKNPRSCSLVPVMRQRGRCSSEPSKHIYTDTQRATFEPSNPESEKEWMTQKLEKKEKALTKLSNLMRDSHKNEEVSAALPPKHSADVDAAEVMLLTISKLKGKVEKMEAEHNLYLKTIGAYQTDVNELRSCNEHQAEQIETLKMCVRKMVKANGFLVDSTTPSVIVKSSDESISVLSTDTESFSSSVGGGTEDYASKDCKDSTASTDDLTASQEYLIESDSKHVLDGSREIEFHGPILDPSVSGKMAIFEDDASSDDSLPEAAHNTFVVPIPTYFHNDATPIRNNRKNKSIKIRDRQRVSI